MRCIFAIDAGGTKCDALLARDDGVVIGWGHQQSSDVPLGRSMLGAGRNRVTINRAAFIALRGQSFDELHLVPGWSPLHLLPYERPILTTLHTCFENQSALELVGEPYGVVVLAGTGAFVNATTRDSRMYHLDGLGPMLGDHGGGYHIGLMALRAAAKTEWHPRHRTTLSTAISQELGIDDPHYGPVKKPTDFPRSYGSGLVKYTLQDHDRSEIAALARIVDREANAGDIIARRILEEAAATIAETLFDVVDKLGIADDDYALIGAGSVATRSDIYWDHLCALARQFVPRYRPLRPDLPPVAGMTLSVLRKLHGGVPPSVRENLEGSLREAMAAPPPHPDDIQLPFPMSAMG
jgi:N-acetylglucosamine kinase-like BadF-type ATPase